MAATKSNRRMKNCELNFPCNDACVSESSELNGKWTENSIVTVEQSL